MLAADYRVLAAADGAQALARARAELPDLVVTDLMLPRLGGDELVAAMRAEPGLAAVPVLVLSAAGDETLRARLLAESVQDYVTKPFSAHELRARARNLVTVKRARDALQRELASQSQGPVGTHARAHCQPARPAAQRGGAAGVGAALAGRCSSIRRWASPW